LQLAVILPCVSLLHLFVCWHSLDYSEVAETRCLVKNETAPFRFRLINTGLFFIPFVRMKLHFESAAFSGFQKYYTAALAPRRAQDCDVVLRCLLAGQFSCGVEAIEARDFLGIFRLRKRVDASFRLTVLPRVIPPAELSLQEGGGFNATAAKFRLQTDPLTISDIRKYEAGDPFRSIHWKLSAKKGELMVKAYEPFAELPAMLLLDLFPGGRHGQELLILRDRIIEYAASLISYCLSEGLNIRLVSYSGGRRMESALADMRDLDAMLQRLAELELDAAVSMRTVLEEFLAGPPAVQNMIVVSADCGVEMSRLLGMAGQSGCAVYLYDANRPVEAAEVSSSENFAAGSSGFTSRVSPTRGGQGVGQ
ncbi:MAG: DUF58 domain-containing protein, partial [Clostridia bacterium]|nr:DUF58 domain-containing protein [Clostridia bacterium]